MASGTLQKRGLIWHAKYWDQGKRRSRTTGKTNRKEAEKWLADLIAPMKAANVARAHLKLAAAAHDAETRLLGAATLVSDIWDIFRKAPERSDCSAQTLADYRALFKKVEKWAAKNDPVIRTIADITAVTASDFAKEFRKTAGHNTYNKAIGCYKMIWKTISLQTGWVSNPWTQVARKQFTAVSKRELSLEELQKVMDVAQGEFKSFMLLGMYTGLRKKDVALLKWSDIDTPGQMIKVTPYKTARKKTAVHVSIPAALTQILTPPARHSAFVLPDIANMYKTQGRTLSRRIAEIFDDAGIRRLALKTPETHACPPVEVGYHSLRHSFVSLCADSGVPMAVVQAIVGHSSPAMTRHYTHIGDEAARRAADALPMLNQPVAAPRLPPQAWVVEELGRMTADNWQVVRQGIIDGSARLGGRGGKVRQDA